MSKSDEKCQKVSKSVKKCQESVKESVKEASTRPQIVRDPASNCTRPNFSNRDFRSVEKCRKVTKSVKKCQKVSRTRQRSVKKASTRPQIVRDPASNCARPNFSNRDFRSVEKLRKVTKSVKKCQKVSKSVKKASKKRQKSVNSASNCARPGLKLCETQFLKPRLSKCRKVSKSDDKCQKVSKSVKKCQKVSRKRLRSRPQTVRDPISQTETFGSLFKLFFEITLLVHSGVITQEQEQQAAQVTHEHELAIREFRRQAEEQPELHKLLWRRQLSQQSTYKAEIHELYTEMLNMREKSEMQSHLSAHMCKLEHTSPSQTLESEPDNLLNTASPGRCSSWILPSDSGSEMMSTPDRPTSSGLVQVL